MWRDQCVWVSKNYFSISDFDEPYSIGGVTLDVAPPVVEGDSTS